MTAREKLVKLIKEGDPDTIERLGLAVAVINLGKQDQFEEARRDGCGEEWLERFKAEHPNYWNLI